MANLLSNTTIGGYQSIHTGNIGSYAITSLSGYATQSYVTSQGYITNLNSYYYVNPGAGNGIGFWNNTPTTYGITMAHTSAGYGAIYDNSDYYLYFSMVSGSNRGFMFRNDYGVIAQMASSGWLMTRGEIYPGYNNGGAGQTSYYIYGNTNNSGLRTNGNWLVNGNLYIGSRDVWFSDWFNQDVRTSASPSFSTVNLNTLNSSDVNARYYYQSTNGVPSNNLGNPTVTEMALFDEQFNNKTAFYDHTALSFWTSSDGVNFTEYTGFSTTDKKRFLGGDTDSGVNIPNLTNRFRIELENTQGYVFLNQLYIYWSSNSHSTKVKIWVRRCDNNQWYQWTDSEQYVSSWPGHLYLPFGGIPFYPGALASSGHYNRIRIEFIPSWSSGTYSYTPINLMRMQIWGGYPAGKRNIYSTDENQNVSFPASITSANTVISTNYQASNAYYLNGTSYFLNSTNGGIYTNARFETASNLVVGGSSSFAGGSTWFGGYGPGSGPGLGLENLGSFARFAFWGLDFYDWNDGIMMTINNGYVSAANSFRAPIFYDSNDTNYYLDPNASTSLKIAGGIETTRSSGTMFSHGSMSDALGWNGNYGTYIGSSVGGTYYLYANGTFFDAGTMRTLIHSGNIGSQSVSYASTSGSANSVAWTNVSGRPTNVSSFTNDSGYYVNGTGNTVNAFAVGYSQTNYDFTLAPRQSIGAMSIKLWDNYFNGSGLGVDYGSLLDIYGRGGHVHSQFYMDANGGLWYRMAAYAGAWISWERFITSNNYNSYSPTLTGGGASGTWGINITGTAARATRANGNFYIDDNYGNGIVGAYASDRYQGVFAMGDSYKLAADGTSPGSLYGLAWTHTNVGGESKSGLSHQLLIMHNGNTQTAIGTGIWTSGLITTTSYGTSANWKTAYDWGNHASAGYLTSGSLSGYATQSWVNSQGFLTSVPAQSQLISPNGASVVAADSAMPNAGHSFIHSLALGPGGNDGHILGMSWAGTTSSYGAQIFIDTDPNDIMAIRSRSSSGVWTSWKTIYHSGNFTNNSSNWDTAYSWGNHASAGYQSASTAITTSNIGSQSVSYASTAGSAPNGSNSNQFYDVNAGVGNGLRFWNGSSAYKISMGVGSLYQYGPVSDYSIKMQMNDGDTGRGFVWGRESYAPIAALNSTSGDMEIAGYMKSYGYRGNGNVGGTGTASWHPDGIYVGSTQWLYGTMYKNGSGIYDVGTIKMNGGPYLETYNTRNLIVRAADNNADVGILGQKSGGGFAFQIYGDGFEYGFLNGTWASWDIRKVPNGAMYMNDDNSWYLQTNSTSNLYITKTALKAHGSMSGYGTGNWVSDFNNTPTSSMTFGQDKYDGGPTGTWWFQVNMRHNNGSNLWGTQLAYGWEDNANEIYQRNVTGGNWSGWVRYINTNNYASILDARYYTESEVNSLLSAKQDSSTAITTSNIGSQSVSYASSAGSLSSMNISQFTNNSGYLSDGGYYDQRVYTRADNYLGGYYVSGGSELPNSSVFGAGKFKVAMLSGGNLGFGGSWNDVLWVSTYSGGDVKSSHALVFDKYSTNVWVSDQNFDSASWGTGYMLWHTAHFSQTNINNWDSAYGWGNHASAGYQSASTAITTSNIGSQSVSNASTVAGLSVHTGRNNEANKVVRTDVNGYIQAGWINTPSGAFSSAINKIYCSDDDYVRYQTPANFISNLGLITTAGGRITGLLQVQGSTGNYNEGIRLEAGTGSWSNIQFGTSSSTSGVQTNQWIVGKRPDGNFVLSLAGSQDSGARLLIGQDGAVTAASFTGSGAGLTGHATNFKSQRAVELNKFGVIYGQDWNTYYVTNHLIVASVGGHSGANRPVTAYDYGSALSYGVDGEDKWQIYFPENSQNVTGAYKKMHYRTGYNNSWSDWRSVVDQVGQVCTIAGSNQTGIEIHSNVSYNQDPLTYLLLRGQADNSWKALKIRLTGDAGGQDIEFRRIAENGADARMWYVPRGTNTVNFDYNIVQPSDARLKDNVTEITNSVDKIKSLRGVEFDWNSGENKDTHDVGLIAQEVEAVLPEAVTTQEDGYKTLAYTKLIPLLVEGMKEQQAMIEALKAEIELLKNK